MLKVTSQPSMSVIPYNNGNKDVLYHNPNDGVLVVHDRQENTISLVSTMTPDTRSENHNRPRTSSQSFTSDQFPHSSGLTKCPNCGFTWNEYPNTTSGRRGRNQVEVCSIYHYLKSISHKGLCIQIILNYWGKYLLPKNEQRNHLLGILHYLMEFLIKDISNDFSKNRSFHTWVRGTRTGLQSKSRVE